MKKYIISILFISMLIISISADGAVVVDIKLETGKVRVGRRFACTVTVEGALDVNTPRIIFPSEVEKLDVSAQSLTRIINGVSSVSKIFTFMLRATSEGKFQIGPVTVMHGGNKYSAGPVQIEVVAPTDSATDPPKTIQEYMEQNLKVSLNTDKKVYYLGEPIIVTGEIDTTLDLRKLGLNYTLSVRSDVFIQKNFDKKKPLQELYYAIKPGTYKIGPITLHGSVPIQKSRRRDPFGFGSFDMFGRRERFNVISNMMEITIKPLPKEGRPENFSNLVGEFDFRADLKQKKVSLGQGVEIELVIDGNGNLEPIRPPVFEEDENFDFYPPEQIFSTKPDALEGKRVYRLKASPKNTEITELPKLVFSYFSPKEDRYVVLEQGPFPIEVLEADAVFDSTGEDGRPSLTIMNAPRRDIFGARRFARRVQTPVSAYIGISRASRAYRRVRKKLGHCKRLIEREKDTSRFHEELHRTLTGYVADKLNIPAAGLTTEATLEEIKTAKLPEETIEGLKEVMERCDLTRFAGAGLDREEMNLSLKSAEKLIGLIEKNWTG